MTDVLKRTAVAGAAVVAAGAYLRWAAQPVMVAYWVGRTIGRASAGKTPAQ